MSEVKNCKVVAFYLGPGRGFRNRNNFDDGYDLMLKVFSRCEKYVSNKKMPYDLIVVHNKTEYDDPVALKELYSWDGQVFGGNKLIVLPRENVGISFGAYNYAFEKFGDRYENWLFTEDDQIFFFHEYYEAHACAFYSVPNTGFLASIGTVDFEHYSDPSYSKCCAYGGVGFSSFEVLNTIYKRYNGLAFYPVENKIVKDKVEDNYLNHTSYSIFGEVEFTVRFLDMGYYVISYPWFYKSSRPPCEDFSHLQYFLYMAYKDEDFCKTVMVD